MASEVIGYGNVIVVRTNRETLDELELSSLQNVLRRRATPDLFYVFDICNVRHLSTAVAEKIVSMAPVFESLAAGISFVGAQDILEVLKKKDVQSTFFYFENTESAVQKTSGLKF